MRRYELRMWFLVSSPMVLHVFTAPYTVNDHFVVYYNKELFKKAGITQPPKTWDEFINSINALKKLDGIAPLGIAEKDRWNGDLLYNELVLGRIQMLFKRHRIGKPALILYPSWKQAKQVDQLVKLGAFQKGYVQMGSDEMNQMFMDGKIGMHALGTWLFPTFGAKMKDNLGYFEFPKTGPDEKYSEHNTSLFGDLPNGFLVSAKTKFPEESAKFAIKYSELVNKALLKSGRAGFIDSDIKPDVPLLEAYQKYLDDASEYTMVQPWWFGVLDAKSVNLCEIYARRISADLNLQIDLLRIWLREWQKSNQKVVIT